jgi:hypothetical protein
MAKARAVFVQVAVLEEYSYFCIDSELLQLAKLSDHL